MPQKLCSPPQMLTTHTLEDGGRTAIPVSAHVSSPIPIFVFSVSIQFRLPARWFFPPAPSPRSNCERKLWRSAGSASQGWSPARNAYRHQPGRPSLATRRSSHAGTRIFPEPQGRPVVQSAHSCLLCPRPCNRRPHRSYNFSCSLQAALRRRRLPMSATYEQRRQMTRLISHNG